MGKCEKCLYYKSKEKCGECGRLSNAMDNNPMFTPNTNYDRIKSMSVEEMAQTINDKTYGCIFRFGCPCNCEDNYSENCVDKIKEWLLQEIREKKK